MSSPVEWIIMSSYFYLRETDGEKKVTHYWFKRQSLSIYSVKILGWFKKTPVLSIKNKSFIDEGVYCGFIYVL